MSRINNSYYAILGILSIGPMSGYKIKATVDEGVGYFWDIDYKQIYPTLKKMVNDGQATFQVFKQGNRPESKVYMLTDSGMTELKNWLMKPVQEGKQSKNELMLKLFFGHHVPIEVNLEHLERYKNSCINNIQAMVNIQKGLENEMIKDDFWHYRMTTVNRGHMIYQTELDWCNETMEYLRNRI